MATARIINIWKASKILFLFYIYPSVCKLELPHLPPPATYSLLCVKTFFKKLADWQLWKLKQIPVHICIFSSVARRWDGIGQDDALGVRQPFAKTAWHAPHRLIHDVILWNIYPLRILRFKEVCWPYWSCSCATAGPERPQRTDTFDKSAYRFIANVFENAQRWALQKSLRIWIPDAKHDETAARLTGSVDRLLYFSDPMWEELKCGKCVWKMGLANYQLCLFKTIYSGY